MMATAQRDDASGYNADLDMLAVNVANEITNVETQDVLRPGIEALQSDGRSITWSQATDAWDVRCWGNTNRAVAVFARGGGAGATIPG